MCIWFLKIFCRASTSPTLKAPGLAVFLRKPPCSCWLLVLGIVLPGVILANSKDSKDLRARLHMSLLAAATAATASELLAPDPNSICVVRLVRSTFLGSISVPCHLRLAVAFAGVPTCAWNHEMHNSHVDIQQLQQLQQPSTTYRT